MYSTTTRSILDTPFSSRPQTTTAMVRSKTLATDIDNVVRRDLQNNFFLCHTDEFLDRFLPVPEYLVEEVFEKLCKDSEPAYKDGRWVRMPTSDNVGEDAHYKPFVDISNAISDVVKASARFKGEGCANGVWVDRHSKSPKSPDEDAADTRPDCLLVTSNAAIERLDGEIAQARIELDDVASSAKDKRKARVKIENSEKRKEKEVGYPSLLLTFND
jgi:hypothetical protein